MQRRNTNSLEAGGYPHTIAPAAARDASLSRKVVAEGLPRMTAE